VRGRSLRTHSDPARLAFIWHFPVCCRCRSGWLGACFVDTNTLVIAMLPTRILIVDDEPHAYQALQLLLRAEGYRVFRHCGHWLCGYVNCGAGATSGGRRLPDQAGGLRRASGEHRARHRATRGERRTPATTRANRAAVSAGAGLRPNRNHTERVAQIVRDHARPGDGTLHAAILSTLSCGCIAPTWKYGPPFASEERGDSQCTCKN
jgi:hypothetical protein